MHLALLALVLLGCAAAPEPAPSPGYDYGGLRKPDELQEHQKDEPVVPPTPAAEETAPKAKPNPCAAPCKKLNDADAACDKAAEQCNEKYEPALEDCRTNCREKAQDGIAVCQGDKACLQLIDHSEKVCSASCPERAYKSAGCADKDTTCQKYSKLKASTERQCSC